MCLQVCLIEVRPVEGAGNKVRPSAEALHLFSSSVVLILGVGGLALQLVHRREVEVARVLIRPRLYDAQSDGAGCASRPRRLKRRTRTPMSPSSSSAYWEVIHGFMGGLRAVVHVSIPDALSKGCSTGCWIRCSRAAEPPSPRTSGPLRYAPSFSRDEQDDRECDSASPFGRPHCFP